jgi:hypothetical protein
LGKPSGQEVWPDSHNLPLKILGFFPKIPL